MIIIKDQIQLKEIQQNHNTFFKSMVKIVIDIEKKLIALDAELHSDLEELLLEQECDQKDLWGANIYFDPPGEIEFTSLINIRPGQNNFGMEVENKDIRNKMKEIVNTLISF